MNRSRKLILGSSSKYRREILEGAGFSFTVSSPQIDEKAIRSSDPYELPLLIARAKAAALAESLGQQDAILITADQVVVCNGELREKPVSIDEAKSFFHAYAEYPAETVSALAVTDLKSSLRHEGVDIAKVYFREIPSAVVEEYCVHGGALYCAGGFEHEHPLLVPYVREIEGSTDSVSGMPLKLLRELLARL